MGKLVTVVGNCGSGKTTLTRLICEQMGCEPLLEQHVERPFQQQFMQDLSRDAFQNQVDYLLFRAEQERSLRAGENVGVQDGGLDQDYYVFSHLFLQKGYLRPAEFELCGRLHQLSRAFLPPPDGIVWLTAPVHVLAARRAKRSRAVDIVLEADLPVIDRLLQQWLERMPPDAPLLAVDASAEGQPFAENLAQVLAFIQEKTRPD